MAAKSRCVRPARPETQVTAGGGGAMTASGPTPADPTAATVDADGPRNGDGPGTPPAKSELAAVHAEIANLGVRAPQRRRVVRTPLEISVAEWGAPDGPVVALLHGGGDFARSFDALAPRLADGGWRVVAWDQRGHGDSGRAALYSWAADLRDAATVLRSSGPGPVRVVGHSKGGVLALELAVLCPDLVTSVAVIDGFTRRQHRPGPLPEVAAHWLDVRRKGRTFRPGSVDDLAVRRQLTNERLSLPWLRYLVTVGADHLGEGRWQWKLDPLSFPSPPHPWPQPASLAMLGSVRQPFLALQAGELEAIADQPSPEVVARHLAPAPGADHVVLDGLGHFAHIEDPDRVAALLLAFLR